MDPGAVLYAGLPLRSTPYCHLDVDPTPTPAYLHSIIRRALSLALALTGYRVYIESFIPNHCVYDGVTWSVHGPVSNLCDARAVSSSCILLSASSRSSLKASSCAVRVGLGYVLIDTRLGPRLGRRCYRSKARGSGIGLKLGSSACSIVYARNLPNSSSAPAAAAWEPFWSCQWGVGAGSRVGLVQLWLRSRKGSTWEFGWIQQ